MPPLGPEKYIPGPPESRATPEQLANLEKAKRWAAGKAFVVMGHRSQTLGDRRFSPVAEYRVEGQPESEVALAWLRGIEKRVSLFTAIGEVSESGDASLRQDTKTRQLIFVDEGDDTYRTEYATGRNYEQLEIADQIEIMLRALETVNAIELSRRVADFEFTLAGALA